MVIRTLHLVLALSLFYFALCSADDKKPYHIKKTSFCYSDRDSEFCSGDKYNFHSVVKEMVDSVDKLSRKQKDAAKNLGVCANALKRAMCSKPNPLCFDGKGDSDAKHVCSQLRKACPVSTKGSLDKFEKECVKSIQRQSTNLTCVDSDTKPKGYCPKPTSKMPASYWWAYEEMSKRLEKPMGFLENVNKLTGVNLLSEDCMKKIKNAVCVPLYCSEDEETIIVPNLQENCNEVLQCINKVSDKYKKLSSILKPIKDSVNKGCDKFVASIKTKVVSGARNDAAITSHTKGLVQELLLIAAALFITYFN